MRLNFLFVALTKQRAREVCGEVARVVEGWRFHFDAKGVSRQDSDLLAQQIDRAFLREQRQALR